jgi:hypothetical protein
MKIYEKKYVKKPSDCTDFEIDSFYFLVLKGKKVQKKGLKERIFNCELLAFYKLNESIVAISAIKRPEESYRKKIIEKANLDRDYKDLLFEIGYSFTEENFRKNGFNSALKLLLLNSLKNLKGILFSTTAISSSQKFLEKNGFVNLGIPYDGKNDKNIKYFEIKLDE